MRHDVIMPALGMAQETGQVVAWLKSRGDVVRQGDALFEVETDKATLEVEAEAPGILLDILVEAGGTAPVGGVIAVIADEGEAKSEVQTDERPAIVASNESPRQDGEKETGQDAASVSEASMPADPARPDAGSRDPAGKRAEARPPADRVLASPKARKAAHLAGLDLRALVESGASEPLRFRDVSAHGATAATAVQSVTARVHADAVNGALGFLHAQGMVEPSRFWAALAASALRATREPEGQVVVECVLPSGETAVLADPDREPLSRPAGAAADARVDLILHDLTSTRFCAAELGGTRAPTLVVCRDRDDIMLSLGFVPAAIGPAMAFALLDAVAARVEQPLRLLL